MTHIRWVFVRRRAPFNDSLTHVPSLAMPRLALLRAVLALAAISVGAPAGAQITVSRSVIEFTDDSRIQDVEIVNTGDVRMYLDMKPAEILEPASNSPVRQELDDPRDAPLIVTPRQLLVAPGERKRVRMILRDELVEERVFRLAINPYVGNVRLDESREGGDTASAIKVLVGYDLLLLARPLPLAPKLDVTRTDDAIEFINTGNTNVLLNSITQCDSEGNDCEELEPDRLYVGETLRLKLPKIGAASEYPVEVHRSVGLENTREVY